MAKKKILIVDDEVDIRNLVRDILSDEGYATLVAENSKQVYDLMGKDKPDLVVLDIWLRDSRHDGLQILEVLKAQGSQFIDIPVVMISGHGTIETAVNAIKIGAYDFIEKPFKSDRLLLMVKRALEASALKLENAELRAKQAAAVEKVNVAHGAENKSGDKGVPAMGELLALPLREAREAFEREYLTSQVERFAGNISKTAQFIGMERSALHRKIKILQKKEFDDDVGNVEDVAIKAVAVQS